MKEKFKNESLVEKISAGLELSNASKALKQMSSLSSRNMFAEFTKQNRLFEEISNPMKGFAMQLMKQQEEYKKMFEPLHLALKESQDNFRRSMQPMIDFQNQFREAMKPISSAQEEIRKILEPISAMQQLADSFSKSLNIPLFEQAVNPFKNLMGSFHPEMWVEFRLRSGYWIIEDKNVINYLVENRSELRNLESFIIKYYSENSWQKLDVIVEGWNDCSKISERLPILKDCFEAVRISDGSNFNVANVVIPTLVAQIEGIKEELLDIPSDEFRDRVKGRVSFEFIPANGALTNGQKKKGKKQDEEFLCHFIEEAFSTHYAYAFYEIIINGLFKNSYEFDEDKKKDNNPINLNRHKILHGDKALLDYGTQENLVRLFLYLDFIIKILAGIGKGNDK